MLFRSDPNPDPEMVPYMATGGALRTGDKPKTSPLTIAYTHTTALKGAPAVDITLMHTTVAWTSIQKNTLVLGHGRENVLGHGRENVFGHGRKIVLIHSHGAITIRARTVEAGAKVWTGGTLKTLETPLLLPPTGSQGTRNPTESVNTNHFI